MTTFTLTTNSVILKELYLNIYQHALFTRVKKHQYQEILQRTPLQQFLFSEDENLYDDLYFDYKFRDLKGTVSKHLSTCSFYESEKTPISRNLAVGDSHITTGA